MPSLVTANSLRPATAHLLLVCSFYLFSCQLARAANLRPIRVEDAIEMTRLADEDYFYGASSAGRVAHYSPDNKRFVVLLRRGNVATNENDYSLYLYETASVFHSPHPRLILRFSTSSNSPAIRDLKWLSDNKTLAFIGERNHTVAQVYLLNIFTKRLKQVTSHRRPVDHFDISMDGRRILFSAESLQSTSLTADQRRHGLAITTQTLEDLYSSRYNFTPLEEDLYVQGQHETKIAVPSTHQINHFSRLSLSPDSRHALITAFFREPDTRWTRYDNQSLKFDATGNTRLDGAATNVAQYFLLDCSKQEMEPFLNAPVLYTSQETWRSDSSAVTLKSYLPLEDVGEDEYRRRTHQQLPALVSVPGKALTVLSDEEWSQYHKVETSVRPTIALHESLSMPPEIFAEDPITHRSVMLMNLNPQFSTLRFGEVRQIEVNVNGITLVAGLYLPTEYQLDKRYPLVIQTHGYDPTRFSMDGREEWSSAFAARALAAKGIAVVQMQNYKNMADYNKVSTDENLGPNAQVRFRNLAVLAYEKVIDELNRQGIVDANNVGISGFSRTVWFVSYLLTHSKTPIRTAVLTDGIDSSYFGYIARGLKEFDADNGGPAPFGQGGLAEWMKEAPGFNLDHINIPVRLVSLSDPTSLWEWFQGMRLQNKPVDMIAIPGASHLLERPWDREIAMQGLVDWFSCWLQHEHNSDAAKELRYQQ